MYLGIANSTYPVTGASPSNTFFETGATVMLTRLASMQAGATGPVRNGDLSTATETVGLAFCLWVLLPLNKTVSPWLTRS